MNNNNTRKNSNSNRSNSNISLEEMTLGKLIMELKKNDEFRKNVKSMFENTNSPLHQDLDNLRNEVNELKNQVAQLREELKNKQVGGDLDNGFNNQENNESPSQHPLNNTNSVLSADITLPTIPQTPVSPITGNQSSQIMQDMGHSPMASRMQSSSPPSGFITNDFSSSWLFSNISGHKSEQLPHPIHSSSLIITFLLIESSTCEI